MARPGFTICVCPDRYLVRTYIEETLTGNPPESPGGLLGPSPSVWERHAFWGDDPLPDAFWEHLTQQGLFGTPKAVIVHNAQNVPAAIWKNLSQTLSVPNADIWPFLCLSVAFERGKAKRPAHIAKLPCIQFAEKQGWVWSSQGIDEYGKAAFVKTEAKKRNISFGPGALEAILPRLPQDAASIGTELDKLGLAAPPGGVIPATLAEILDRETEPDVFSIIRNLQQPRGGQGALAVWDQALASERGSDSMTFALLSMLAREARQLWQICVGEPVRLPGHILSAKTTLARSLGLAGIARLWHLALEADKGIKTGERSPDQALDSLLASLSLLFSPSGRGRP